MGDLCFQSPERAAGARGLAAGGLARRACWWRCLALLPHCGFSNELKAQGRGVGRGWFPDELSGLPTADSEAPLVSAAPSALIQLHGQSLLGSASDIRPLCHQPSPLSLCTGDNAVLLRPSLVLPSLYFPKVERVRAGNLADGWASQLWSSN